MVVLRIYTLLIRLYGLGISIASVISPKARLWVSGRRRQQTRLNDLDLIRPIWVHVASLGEFEQGRPIIEALKSQYPDLPLLLTFFSPSGYEIRKDFDRADAVFYLPLDTPRSVTQFLDAVTPRMAIFVKYDFWFHYLSGLQQREIPIIFVSVLFRPGHYLFRPFSRPLLSILARCDHFFVQNVGSQDLLTAHGITQVTAAGDTRIDRVLSLQEAPRSYPTISAAAKDKFVIVFGSIWPEDMKILQPFIQVHRKGNLLFILAPHEVSPKHLGSIDALFDSRIARLSEGASAEIEDALLVDTIGDLAHLYSLADLAYVGGGFGKGIHSILEPAAAEIPIIFGPKYDRFDEAVALVAAGAARAVSDAPSFSAAFDFFAQESHRIAAIEAIRNYLGHSRGATSTILSYLREHYLSERESN